MEARLEPGATFLWADEDPKRAARIKQGEIEVAPRIGHGWKSAPGGLIHDWIGAIFIPDASLDDLSRVLEDYGRYKEVYKPVIVDSHLERRVDGTECFSMRWLKKALFVTAAFDTQNESRTYRVDARRAYTISQTISLREIQNYGKPDQRELPPDEGNGFIWRLHVIDRYEERDGGVYLEVEAMVLSRGIPAALRFAVSPAVKDLSRDLLKMWLEATRKAVHPKQT
ncbi:MAG TPA: hypothetical protein VHZ07_28090 [Bryobacteraceae bacterium]|nr:hypothetical protein [Bryobacteraceae bacterium]